MTSIARVGVVAKARLQDATPHLVNVEKWLGERGIDVVFETATAALMPANSHRRVADREPLVAEVGLVLVLGGDGTLLSTSRAVARAAIPVLGVNLGSLGFLTEVPLAELYDALEEVDQKRASVESRALVQCQLMREGNCLLKYAALNDVIVNKSAIARLNDYDLYIDKVLVTEYKADGLIVSTPTGSTAYSMAAGGPILTPSVDAFVITPVSPHSLTHRPLVVRDSVEIEIVVKTGADTAYLSVDGQVGMPVRDGDRVVCRKSEYKVQLLRIRRAFFEVLRTKLKWGQR